MNQFLPKFQWIIYGWYLNWTKKNQISNLKSVDAINLTIMFLKEIAYRNSLQNIYIYKKAFFLKHHYSTMFKYLWSMQNSNEYPWKGSKFWYWLPQLKSYLKKLKLIHWKTEIHFLFITSLQQIQIIQIRKQKIA